MICVQKINTRFRFLLAALPAAYLSTSQTRGMLTPHVKEKFLLVSSLRIYTNLYIPLQIFVGAFGRLTSLKSTQL